MKRLAKRITTALLLILSLSIAFPGEVSPVGVHQDIVDSEMRLRRWYLSWYPEKIAITFIAIEDHETEPTPRNLDFTLGQFERSSSEIAIIEEHNQERICLWVTTCITLNRWFIAALLIIYPAFVIRNEYHRWQLQRAAAHPCPTCHFDLTGNQSGTCPECGSAITQPPPSSGS